MHTLTQLTLSNYADLEGLMTSRNRFLAVAGDNQDSFRKIGLTTAYDLLNVGPDVGRIFGAYVDDALVGAAFTSVSSTHPCFYLNKAYTSPGAPADVLPVLLEHLIWVYSELGYKRFYTLYRKQDLETYHRLWRTASVLKDYVAYTDYESAPNERPKHSDFWELLYGRSLYPEEMMVRAFVKKDDTMYWHGGQQQ